MNEKDRLLKDLEAHRRAYAEGVMKVEHRAITAASTVDILTRVIRYLEDKECL